MSTLVNSSSSSSIDGFFQKCIQNMYTQIKEHDLTEQFLNLFRNDGNLKRGVMFCDAPVILKIIDITQDDGHSGASFACCCHNVYAKFRQEEKQRLRSRFKGIIRGIVQLKKLQRKTLESYYAPGGKGFLLAQCEFQNLQQSLSNG